MAKENNKMANKPYIARKKGKKYFESYNKINKDTEYTLDEAVALLSETTYTKFDGTCEIHVRLNADPKQADQTVRSTIVLPHGSGKSPRIAAFVSEDKVKAATAAGADKAGLEMLIDEVNSGKLDFDVAVATPDVMKNIAKVAKTLGQKGLMPNPKAGTVTPDFEKAIQEIKKGKIEFRNDKNAIIHSIFGKVSFGKDKLTENLKALIKAILDAKPTGIKSNYITSISVNATMGPGIRLNVNEASDSSKK